MDQKTRWLGGKRLQVKDYQNQHKIDIKQFNKMQKVGRSLSN